MGGEDFGFHGKLLISDLIIMIHSDYCNATVRLDADVLAWLKAQGKGYQTRIKRFGLEMSPAFTQEVQLICNCCGQPYYPNKSWEDRRRAMIFGAERFAVCPICTQSAPQDVFDNPEYRRRCFREVRRLPSA